MGGSFNAYVYKGTKEQIENNWDEDCEQSLHSSGHEYSGEIGMMSGLGIRWHDKEFESESEADDYLCDTHAKWDGAIAVSFGAGADKRWLVGGWCSS